MKAKARKRATVAQRRAATVTRAGVTGDGAVRAAIVALEDSEGRLTPEGVVKAAARADSPLHSHFEWDDSKAGHAYRLQQARQLIRSVQVEITTEERVISTVHYVRDPRAAEEDEQGYVSVNRLKTEPEHARALIQSEFARASACLHRATDLAAVLGMKREVAAISRKVDAVREKVERQTV